MRSRDWRVSEYPHPASIGSRRPARPPSPLALFLYTALHRSRRLQLLVHPSPLPPPIVIVLHRHVAPREAEEEGEAAPGWSLARTCGSWTGRLLMESGRFEDDFPPSNTLLDDTGFGGKHRPLLILGFLPSLSASASWRYQCAERGAHGYAGQQWPPSPPILQLRGGRVAVLAGARSRHPQISRVRKDRLLRLSRFRPHWGLRGRLALEQGARLQIGKMAMNPLFFTGCAYSSRFAAAMYVRICLHKRHRPAPCIDHHLGSAPGKTGRCWDLGPSVRRGLS